MRSPLRAFVVSLAPVFALLAQTPPPPQQPAANVDWRKTEKLPDVDFLDLSAAQKQAVLKILREQDCSCQCGMKLAECRLADTSCYFSKTLAKIAVDSARNGKTPDEIRKSLAAGPKYTQPKMLEEAIVIPTAGSPVRGPKDAKITLVEFSDFECPYCSKATGEVAAIMRAYPGQIKLIYKQFPLSMHPHAELAAQASLAANEQGKFWELHDKMFANFRQLSRQNILTWAKELGLDMNKFTTDLDSGKYKPAISKDMKDGDTAGVMGTPAFYINSKHYNGSLEMAALKPILDAELKGGTAATARR